MKKSQHLKHLIASILLLCMFSSLSVIVSAQVVNTTHAGTGPYATIQAAINDPATVTGDVITVAPGTYPENVTLNKSLTINGAQAGVDARGRVVGVPNPVVESVIAPVSGAPLELLAGSSNSTIDGFSMIGNVTGTNGVIQTLSAILSGVQLKNNYLKVTSTTGQALWFNRGITDVTIDKNEMIGGSGSTQMIFLNGPQSFAGMFLTNNNILGGGGTYGLFVDGNRTVGTSATPRNPLFQGNLFQGLVAGINAGSRSLENAQFLENTFNNNSQLGFQGGPKNSNFARNTFTNNGLYGMSLTAFGSTDPLRGGQGTTIQNNFFSSNATASGAFGDILISNQTTGTQNSNTITNNSLGSAIGIYNNEPDGSTDPIHATCNWFGTATAAGVAAKIFNVAGGVTLYTPWLTSGTDDDLVTAGFQPVSGSCSGGLPVHNITQSTNYSTIQSAVNAANPNDVIVADAGTYNENVIINTPLTLQGAGNTTILTPSTACSGTGINITANNVFVKNLKVTNYTIGITVAASNITVDNVESVSNCTTGIEMSNGISALIVKNSKINSNSVGFRAGTGAQMSNITIDNCEVKSNVQGTFIAATASGSNSFDNISIKNSDFSSNTQKGMYFEKLSNAVIENIIMNNSGTDATYNSNAGIDINLKYGNYSNVTVKNSTITGCGVFGTATSVQAPVAVTIKARDDAPSYNGTPATLSNVNVLNNIIGGPQNGLRFGESDKTNATPTNVEVHENDLSAAFANKAIINNTPVTTNATCNWFGTTNAANVAAKISGPVTYAPFITNGTDNSPSSGFQPVPNSCTGCPGGSVTNTTTGITYCSIQAAIDDPQTLNGHTLVAGAGTYNESIVITKELTLNGPNLNTDCSGSRVAEAIIIGAGGSNNVAVKIASNNVTVNGFTIKNPTGSYGVSAQGRSNITVDYNIITDVGDNVSGTGVSYGVQIESNAAASSVNITHNCVNNIRGGQTLPTSATNGSGFGIGANSTNSVFDLTGLDISYNVISAISASPFNGTGGKGAYGVIINIGAVATGKAVNATVTNNDISNLNGRWAHGVGLEGNTPNALVVNNAFSSFTSAATDNVAVNVEDNASVATVQIHENSLLNSGFGVGNATATAVNATCNWFGTTNPAGVAAKISGPVNYTPYLTNGTDNSTTTGFQPVPNSCTGCVGGSVTNTNTGFVYCSIQAAIDAPQTLNGHTLVAGAGTYNESVTVNKSLTIKGAQADNCAATRSGAESIISCPQGIGINASNVTINGFTIQDQDGATFGNSGPGFGYAIFMAPPNTGTQLINNIIKNNSIGTGLSNAGTSPSQVLIRCNWFDSNNKPGPASGAGIYTDESVSQGVVSNVLIDNNKFTGNGDAGIDFSTSDPSKASTGITISSNNFDGNDRAVFLYNVVSSTFSSNEVHNSTGTGSGDVRIYGGVNNFTITNNNFGNNAPRAIRITDDGGINSSNVTANYNSFLGYSATNPAIEIVLGYTGTLNAECNWYGTNDGSVIATQIVGPVDYSPWLTSGTDGSSSIGFQPTGSCTGTPADYDGDGVPNADDCDPLNPNVGAKPKLNTSINGVIVNSNNDGLDDNASFTVCNTPNNIVFDYFVDDNGATGAMVKAFQIIQNTNVSVPFCNNCSAVLTAFAGTTGTASLINPNMSGTLVMKFQEFFDTNGNGQIDANECAGDVVIYTVTVNPLPAVTCPANTNTASCQTQAAVDAAYATWLASASATNGTLSNNSTGAPDKCGGTTNVTFTGTNSCGTTTCSASFTVTSATAVVLNCPATTTVASCQTQSAVDAEYASWLATVSTSGGCNTSLTNNSTGAPLACGGTKTVTFTVTSSCDVVRTCSASFTVTSAPAVVLTCPANTIVASGQTQGDVNAEFNAWLATVSTSGGCNASLTNNSTGAPLASGGTTTVTFSVTSSCEANKTCNATFTVTTGSAVVLTCPANKTVASCQAQSAVNAEYTAWLATASTSGGCNRSLTNNSTGAPNACGGTTAVTFTVTSSCGPNVTCSASFTVTSATPVVLTCPTNKTVASCQTQAAVNAAYTTWLATVSTSGGCNTVLSNNSTGAPNACGGTKMVTFTLSSCGTNKTCSATFTVTADLTAPVISHCPSNITSCNSNVSWTVPTASDNCKLQSFTSNHNCGETFPIGTTTVIYTAKDACGNTSTCSFTVTVNTLPNAGTISGASTVCIGSTTPFTISGNSISGTWSSSNTAVATVTSGGVVKGIASGTATIKYTVTNNCGSKYASKSITVASNAPVIICPSGSPCTRYVVGATCKYNISGNEFNATATSCGVPVLSYTLSGATSGTGTSLAGVQLNKGVTTVTWKATNGSLSSSCSFTVNVNDNQRPSITCKPGVTKKVANSATYYTVSGTEFNATASDNCGTPTLIYSLSGATSAAYSSSNTSLTGKKLNLGTTTITWKATDGSDNVSTCTTIIKVTKDNYSVTNSLNGIMIEPVQGTLTVKVIPNPSLTYFTLLIKSPGKDKVNMKVTDLLGRLIEVKPDISPNSTIQLGSNYSPGAYIAEIIQGKERVAVKLFKIYR